MLSKCTIFQIRVALKQMQRLAHAKTTVCVFPMTRQLRNAYVKMEIGVIFANQVIKSNEY